MAFPKTVFPSELAPTTRKELDISNARAKKMLANQHKANGSHGAVTADSLVVTGETEFEGEVILDAGITVAGNVGITGNLAVTGTSLFTGRSTFGGAIVTNAAGKGTLAISGNTSLNPNGFNAVTVLSAASTPVLYQIVAPNPGVGGGGYFLWLISMASTSYTISHRSGSVSNAANRINCPNGVDFTVQPFQGVLVFWDSLNEMWYLLGADLAYTPPATPTWTTYTGTYTGNGAMTWTGISATTLAWTRFGTAMTISFLIDGTVGGTPNTVLSVSLPAGITATKQMNGSTLVITGGGYSMSTCFVAASGTTIGFVALSGGAVVNWAAGANQVAGQITFEVNP